MISKTRNETGPILVQTPMDMAGLNVLEKIAGMIVREKINLKVCFAEYQKSFDYVPKGANDWSEAKKNLEIFESENVGKGKILKISRTENGYQFSWGDRNSIDVAGRHVHAIGEAFYDMLRFAL